MSAAAASKKQKRSVGYYAGMSDLELLATDLILTGSPADQHGVLTTMPVGAKFIKFVNTYHHQDWVRCVLGHEHKKGFTALLDTGDLVLLGNICGKEHLEEDLSIFSSDISQAIRRKRLLEWQYDVREVFPKVAYLFDEWEETAKEFTRRKANLREAAPALFGRLQHSADHEKGLLKIEELTRDYAAEEARANRHEKRTDPIYTPTVVKSYRIDGLEFFRVQSALHDIREAVKVLQQVNWSLQRSQLSILELQTLRQNYTRSCLTLAEAAAAVGAYQRFARKRVLQDVAEYANREERISERFAVFEHGLVTLNRREKAETVVVPFGGLGRVDLEPLDRLQATLMRN